MRKISLLALAAISTLVGACTSQQEAATAAAVATACTAEQIAAAGPGKSLAAHNPQAAAIIGDGCTLAPVGIALIPLKATPQTVTVPAAAAVSAPAAPVTSAPAA